MKFEHGQALYSVYAYSQDYKHGNIESWHNHHHIQLLHTLSGVVEVETAEGIWIAPPNKGVWIPAHCEHQLKIFGDAQIRGVFIEPLARANLKATCQVIAVPQLLKALICSAIDITTKVMPHSREERLLELILDEIHFLDEVPFQLPQPQSLSLKKICHLLNQNLERNWTLDDLSQHFFMSTKTISRYFKQETQLTFSAWLRQAKLLKALHYLALGRPVLTTAIDLGYDNQSAFSAMFKRELGITPREYIKMSISQ